MSYNAFRRNVGAGLAPPACCGFVLYRHVLRFYTARCNGGGSAPLSFRVERKRRWRCKERQPRGVSISPWRSSDRPRRGCDPFLEFPGAQGWVRVRLGAREVATFYRAGGVEPRPYGNGGRFCGFALVRSNLRVRTEQSFRHGCAVPPPFTQGRLWCGQNAQQLKNKNPSPHQSASPTASPRGEAIYKKCLTFLKMRI